MRNISLNFKVMDDFTENEVQEILKSTLERELQRIQFKKEQYKRICSEFEEKYGLNSEEFYKRFQEGKLGDDQVYFDWFAAKKGYDIWYKKLQVLSGVNF